MKKLAFAALAIVLFNGCRKEPDLYKLSDDMLVATKYDASADFGAYKTFKIADQIGIITNDPSVDDTVLSPSIASQLIARVRANMVARGYTEVMLTDTADLGINISVIKTLNSVDVVYPGYWWGYAGYWDPWYWGGCYSCYYSYPYYYSYSYNTGSVIVEMIDLDSSNNNDKLIVRWTGLGNGMLTDYNTNNITLAKNAIDQMYSQSPYILSRP